MLSNLVERESSPWAMIFAGSWASVVVAAAEWDRLLPVLLLAAINTAGAVIIAWIQARRPPSDPRRDRLPPSGPA